MLRGREPPREEGCNQANEDHEGGERSLGKT